MIKKFFSLDENFDRIIRESLPNSEVKGLNFISTGWTNIVYEVETNSGNYFFRFPRDDFWIRTIEKDCQFADYIKGKTSFNTADLKLYKNQGRGYSVHKKVEGEPLTNRMNDMSTQEIEKVSKQIAEFMYQLHTIPYKKDEIFSIDNIGVKLVDFLDELIELHLDDEAKKFWKYKEFSQKENNCLVHGDLNPGNIIIDDNNNIASVIDFGFGGFGNKYFDIARIIGRLPDSFKNYIIRNYEELSGEKLDKVVLENEINIWNDIDNGYIKYMRGIGIYK